MANDNVIIFEKQNTNSLVQKNFSFILIDLNNSVNLTQFCAFIEQNYFDSEVIYCSSKQQNMQNVKSFVFDQNENSEKILNAVTNKCSKTNIVVIRKFTSFEEIKKQTDALVKNNQIVYFKKEQNKFKTFWCNIFKKLAGSVFYKQVLMANASCVTYGETASNVLKKLDNPSNLMRTNTWQGIDYVALDGGEHVSFKYNKIKSVLCCILPLVMSVLFVTFFFVFKSKLDVLFKIIFWLCAIIGLLLFGVYGINWFIKSQIGENIAEKAKIKGE